MIKSAFARTVFSALIISISAAALLFIGCTNVTPMLEPGITPAPIESASPPPAVTSAEPTVEPEASASPGGIGSTDALGNVIRDEEHFQQYLQFNSIRVYEEGGDTFVDCSVVNSYPDPIVCAVNIRFFDENGIEIASSSLQMPDGSFMLRLANGETPLYARVLSDITLTDCAFELNFDPSVGVAPNP